VVKDELLDGLSFRKREWGDIAGGCQLVYGCDQGVEGPPR
jgi:hypothetical protein